MNSKNIFTEVFYLRHPGCIMFMNDKGREPNYLAGYFDNFAIAFPCNSNIELLHSSGSENLADKIILIRIYLIEFGSLKPILKHIMKENIIKNDEIVNRRIDLV